MRRYDKLNKSTEAGYVLISAAAFALAFCAILGLATDVGSLYYQKGRMQAAADSAAIAGAREVLRGGSETTITTSAQADSTLNGYTTGVNGATVTVYHPPTSGPHMSDTDFVEVIVRRPEPTFFFRALGISSADVKARAVAGVEGGEDCFFILDLSVRNAFVVSGDTVNAPCGVIVNSSDSAAMSANGANLNTPYSIGVTGGYGGCCYSPTPITGVQPVEDPLWKVAEPTVPATCDQTNLTINTSTDLTPGTYCGGIDISGSTTTVNFAAGTYILKGGGLHIQASTVNGTGVTFYNTCSSGSCALSETTPPGTYSQIEVKSGAVVTLKAPTSGPMDNILFFADRNAPSATPANDLHFQGSTLDFEGTLYAKTERIFFSGNSAATTLNVNIVSRMFNFTGSSDLNLHHLFASSPIKQVYLSE